VQPVGVTETVKGGNAKNLLQSAPKRSGKRNHGGGRSRDSTGNQKLKKKRWAGSLPALWTGGGKLNATLPPWSGGSEDGDIIRRQPGIGFSEDQLSFTVEPSLENGQKGGGEEDTKKIVPICKG